MGRLAQTICLIEVYRNAVNSDQIMNCVSKLVSAKNNRLKQLKKEKKEINQTMLWIITPTISQRILDEFKAQPRDDWEWVNEILVGNVETNVSVGRLRRCGRCGRNI